MIVAQRVTMMCGFLLGDKNSLGAEKDPMTTGRRGVIFYRNAA